MALPSFPLPSVRLIPHPSYLSFRSPLIPLLPLLPPSLSSRSPLIRLPPHSAPLLAPLDTSLPEDVRALAEHVRGFLRSSFPDLDERLYAGARSAGYRTQAGGTILGLFIRGGAVHLVFTHGADLPDEAGLLRGEGTTVKWVTVRPGEDLPEEELFALVVAAMLVGAGGTSARSGR